MRGTLGLWCVLASLGGGWMCAGCDAATCKSYAAHGLVVTVHDETGARICDATVVATDGRFSERLEPFAADLEICTYQGALERKGNYSITATAGGRSTTVGDVRVRADECHVIAARPDVIVESV